MNYNKAKLFWKYENNTNHIKCVPYPDDIEYYSFLKKYREQGLRQVVISSEIMIEIIRYCYTKKNHRIYDIDFVEDDSELDNEIKILIKQTSANPAYLIYLLDKLKFLSEKSSIDINRIYFKSLYENDEFYNYYIQSNGIIGINSESFKEFSIELSSFIEGCLI